MPKSEKELNRILIKKQAEYRKQGKSAAWLASYARGFKNPKFNAK